MGMIDVPWSLRMYRVLLVAVIAVGLSLGVGATAAAAGHAVLLASGPEDGATLKAVPSHVWLRFSEPVGLPTEPVRVFDATAARVDDGKAGYGEERSLVRVGLPGNLRDGVYTVTWRVVSVDTHPVRGALTFTVGDVGDIPAPDVAELDDGGGAGWDVPAAGLRWLTYLGTLLAVGMAVFLLVVHDRVPAERGRLAGLLGIGAAVAAVAALFSVPVQATLIGEPLTTTVSSTFGMSVLVRVAGLALMWVGLAWLFRRWAQGMTAAAALLALASFQLAGHTVATEPRLLVIASNLAHIAAASVWFGGLVALAVVLLSRRRAGADAVAGARLVARFSMLATVTVLIVVAGGTGLAWSEVRTWPNLFSTVYGWTLLAKITLVAGVLTVGAHNNRRLVPAVRRGAERAWQRLSRTVRLEVSGLVAVLAVTAMLVSIVPARMTGPDAAHAAEHVPAGPFAQHVRLGPDHHAQVTVDPARPGSNEVTVALLDAKGAAADIGQQVELQFSLPSAGIAPIGRTPRDAGPGRYRHTGPELTIAGTWHIEIRVLVSDFERLTATTHVPISTR